MIKDFIIAHYIHYGELPNEEKIEEFATLMLHYLPSENTIIEWHNGDNLDRNTKEIIDYLNTDEDGDEFFSVKMNGISFK